MLDKEIMEGHSLDDILEDSNFNLDYTDKYTETPGDDTKGIRLGDRGNTWASSVNKQLDIPKDKDKASPITPRHTERALPKPSLLFTKNSDNRFTNPEGMSAREAMRKSSPFVDSCRKASVRPASWSFVPC